VKILAIKKNIMQAPIKKSSDAEYGISSKKRGEPIPSKEYSITKIKRRGYKPLQQSHSDSGAILV